LIVLGLNLIASAPQTGCESIPKGIREFPVLAGPLDEFRKNAADIDALQLVTACD
jgi:hypothetical protein